MSEISIVLPYFNEADWIGATIDSLVEQACPDFHLILVDNASTDKGPEIARRHAAPLGDRVRHVTCGVPGKINALATGLAHVKTSYVATCDADTIYPPHYLTRAIELFDQSPAPVAVMAIDLYGSPNAVSSLARSSFILRKAQRYPDKCHAGGYAQAFRTDALRAVGGFDPEIWPYVLEDHEIVDRLQPHGPVVYSRDHYCFASSRRESRSNVSWNAFERLVYRHTPRAGMKWFFYRFLGPRLKRRRAMSAALQSKPWEGKIQTA